MNALRITPLDGAIVGTYTIFGGLRSVLWTDLLQTSLLILGGAIRFC